MVHDFQLLSVAVMSKIALLDKEFELFISKPEIDSCVDTLAQQISHDLNGKDTIFLVILNGAFVFAADLLRSVSIINQISFLKLASYEGINSTGKVKQLIGLSEDLTGKHVVIVEDIVDTGTTLESIIEQVEIHNPADIRVATMFIKREIFIKNIEVKYVGMEIPNKFIVGYGLDYNGYGRNLPDVYQLVNK